MKSEALRFTPGNAIRDLARGIDAITSSVWTDTAKKEEQPDLG
jgi:hypothetical protein